MDVLSRNQSFNAIKKQNRLNRVKEKVISFQQNTVIVRVEGAVLILIALLPLICQMCNMMKCVLHGIKDLFSELNANNKSRVTTSKHIIDRVQGFLVQ